MKSKSIQDQALIIFGASGDLTYRKLIPAIFDLHKQNSLPKNFAVLGVARSQFTDDTFRDKMKDGIKQFALAKDALDEEIEQFCQKLHYLSINTDDGTEYSKLKARLDTLDKEEGTAGNYIFYLSTPPSLYPLIPKFLAEQGLNQENGNFRRIII